MNRDSEAPKPKRRFFRWLIRSLKVFLVFVLTYVIIILVGLIPTNNDFVPPDNGVEVTIVSNPVHADIVVPISNDQYDWRSFIDFSQFPGDTDNATHIAFGWGDKGFYLNTPTWSDLRASTVANALLTNSPCCMHVQLMRFSKPPVNSKQVTISNSQYQTLIRCISESFANESDDKPTPIADAAYNTWDRFYDAEGNYHLFNTCNSWVGSCLKETGVRTPLYSPLPGSPTLYFPE
ncbi:MAG: TIGR02117 family protein [Planctomycetota bacterium]